MKTFKTEPFAHQRRALRLSRDKEVFALLMEQGTGKTKVAIDTIAHLWRKRRIDFVLVIPPKGPAPNWLYDEFPKHMPDDVKYVAALWKTKSGTTVANRRAVVRVTDRIGARVGERTLPIIIMNVEAFGATADALDFAIECLDRANSALVIVDESHRIKSPSAHSTKRILNLRLRSAFRRILTGTVSSQGPFDLYSQFGFLDPKILEIDSFTAFKAEYAELLPAQAGVMRHIARRIPKVWSGRYIDDITGEVSDEKYNDDGTRREREMVPRYLPAIVARDADGNPRYKNLDRLAALIRPYSYRVRKEECLDLPEKVYSKYYYDLTARQRALYEQLKERQRIELGEGRVLVVNKLTMILRRQQIVCGYLPDGTAGAIYEIFTDWEDNPRILTLLDLLDQRPIEERAIIWCRFREDIRRVVEAISAKYGPASVVQFHGSVSDRDRAENVARFQGHRHDRRSGRDSPVPDEERARFMVAQQHSGREGQTWTAASLVVYYSNTFDLLDRLQSEDRAHRIGQTRTVQYYDLVADETVDQFIISNLVAKKNIADVISGDPHNTWIEL